ncbi:MAG: UDP-N-acetylmuramyl-tripeptide synthetase [Candidatus Kerfeldbacteria bacterium]
MWYSVKTFLLKFVPPSWLSTYHLSLAVLSALLYRDPSRGMIVIGVTGTKGKSTISNMLWEFLTDAGHTVGMTGTVNYRIGDEYFLNEDKMTMPGRFKLQSLMRRMKDNGCDIAIIETTSEGIKQWRHLGIDYDVCVFTNLSPEHIEAHGSFEYYKQAKMELFRHLGDLAVKEIDGKNVPRASVINMDSDYAMDFKNIGNYKKITLGKGEDNDLRMSDVNETVGGTEFKVNGQSVFIPHLGEWNAYNCLTAMAAAMAVGAELPQLIAKAPKLEPAPGRMEFIKEGQPFAVIVDYAYEPLSLGLLYTFCRKLVGEGNKLITLISSTGGGRDVARRPKNGEVAGKMCDFVIVTDEDPYDDDPMEIIDQVAEGVKQAGKTEGVDFWRELDRRHAVEKAFKLAKPGDLVILTAKGAEQKMVVAGGKKIDWDDREVAREELKSLLGK